MIASNIASATACSALASPGPGAGPIRLPLARCLVSWGRDMGYFRAAS